MHRILIFGAGKIGSLVSVLLANSGNYDVTLADIDIDAPHIHPNIKKIPALKLVSLNVEDTSAIENFLQKNSFSALISCLPYYQNSHVIKFAKQFDLHYFDLTEDRETAKLAATYANTQRAFVPQCGLAPGFISIVANSIMGNFSELDSVKLRVGALPITISNALHYSLTWSTDGLINEYGNLCQAIVDKQEVQLPPLNDVEVIEIDGLTYEAFNTSGGIGTLADTYQGCVNNMNYKTIRYPGHCEKMYFLMNDLKLNYDRGTLKKILENVLPKTNQDVVLVYVSVTGKQRQQLIEENYVKKFYPKIIANIPWSAIQLTTASSLCTIVDIVLNHPENYHGLIKQEQFSFTQFLNNPFGKYYAE